MAPNSRPPLTSRIRASFDGKRSRSEVASPTHTNGFITQDPESLQKAIDEAINSETFQKAIAANLAKLIKPSIKSALDTIQPVVEAVYSHELLLRKTNQSVEDILYRLDSQGVTSRRESVASRRESLVEPLGPEPDDEVSTTEVDDGGGKTPTQETPRELSKSNPDLTQHKQLLEDNHAKTTSALAALSSNVEVSNTKISEALQGISDVDMKLRWTSDNIETLKSDAEESHTTMAVLQAQLDQLKEDIGQLMTAVGSDLGKKVQALGGAKDTSLFDSHTTKLDAISTDLVALKGTEKIDAVSTELASLRTTIESGISTNSENFMSLGSQIGTVLTTLEGHADKLDEIKDKGPHPEILAAVQKSNDSHAAHAVSLGEIKDRSIPEPAPATTENGTDPTAALQELKSDLASLKQNIEAGLTSNNENITKVHDAVSTIPGADILAAVQHSNESHASHAAILDEVRTHSGTHTASLDELKSREVSTPLATVDTSELTAKIDGLHETINAHTAALDDIKAIGGSHTASLDELKKREMSPPAAATLDTSELTAQMNDIHEAVNAHAASLDELKARDVPVAATSMDTSDLTAQMNAISETINAHTAALEEIKANSGLHATSLDELKTREIPSTSATALDSSELTTKIDTISEAINAHTAALDEIKANGGAHLTALESHGSALEGLKSINAVPESVAETEVSNIAPLEAHMSSIVSILEEHSEALNEIKSATGTHTSALESHGTALEGFRSKDVLSPVIDNSGLEAQVTELVTKLETALEEIKASGNSHTAALETHGSIIEDWKSVGPNVDLSGLEGHTSSIIATLESHTAALEHLKTANTGLEQSRSISDTPIVDNSALEHQINTIISTLQSHTTTLDDLKSPTLPPTSSGIDSTSFSALEIKLGSIISTLNHQTSAIASLQPLTSSSSDSPETTSKELTEPTEGLMETIVDTLEMHTTLLNEMKEDVSAEILSTLHDLASGQGNMSSLLTEIREADLSDEVLTLLHEHKSLLDEMRAGSEVHGAALEEIKMRSPDTIAEPIDGSGVETKIDSMITALKEHKSVLDEIKDKTTSSHELHTAHGGVLEEIKSRSIDAQPTSTVDISSLETQLASINTALEGHQASFAEMKELHASHGASLDEIKSTPSATDLSGLETQLGAITAAIEEHKNAISEVKDLHVSHGNSLGEINSRSLEPTSAPITDLSGLETQLGAITAALLEAKELHVSHGTSLDEMKSRSLEVQPTSDVDLSGLEAQLGAITTALEEHKTSLSEMKELHTAHGASLDEIKARSLEALPVEATDLSGLETQLASVAAALDEHKTTLSEMKEMHASHGTSLDDIKTRALETPSAPVTDLSGLEAQLISIATSLVEHKATLDEVKSTSLASHELHTLHATSLDDIKARAIEPAVDTPAIDISSLEAQMGTINCSIDEIKAKSLEPAASAIPVDLSGLESQLAGLSTILEEHKATLSEVKATSLASQDMHTAHATRLDEIKSRSIESPPVDLSSLETQLNVITASLDEHKNILSNISEATLLSNNSHAAHAAILSDIKDASLASNESHSAHATALSDIKDATSSWNEAHSANAFTLAEIKDAALAGNESHMSHAAVLNEVRDGVERGNEAHTSHTSAFGELKAIPSSDDVALDLSPIEGQLTTIISTMEGHTTNLAEIKEASSHEDILTNISELKSIISDSHAETKDSHSHLTETLGALALGGAAGAGSTALLSSDSDSSKEILGEVKTLNESLTSLSSQIQINHTTTTTCLNTLSDELKAEIDATGTALSSSLPLSIDPLSSSLKTVETKLEGLEGSVKQTGSFVVGLYEGIHLNDTGVGQLQEQLVSWVVKGGVATPKDAFLGQEERGVEEEGLNVPIDEAAWFHKKRAPSPSPLREVSTVSPSAELAERGVEERGVEGEEEMPSIDSVIGGREVLGGAAALGVIGAGVAVYEHEKVEDDSGEVVPDVEKEVEDSTMKPTVDESKDIEELETVVENTPVPEALVGDTLAESENSGDQEIEQPQEVEPESIEESILVEPEPISTEPEAIESEIPEEIHEESIIPDTLEEGATIGPEPTVDQEKEVEPLSPADTEGSFDRKNSPKAEPAESEPIVEETTLLENHKEGDSALATENLDMLDHVPAEEHLEEAIVPESLVESVPNESEVPIQDLRETDNQLPSEIEEADHEGELHTKPEAEILKDMDDSMEKSAIGGHVEDEAPEISEAIESKDVEESLPIHEEEQPAPEKNDALLESEPAPEEEGAEEPIETEHNVESAIHQPEQDTTPTEPELPEHIPEEGYELGIEDNALVHHEEPIEESKAVETEPVVGGSLIPDSEEHESFAEHIHKEAEHPSIEHSTHEQPVEEETTEPTPIVEDTLILESDAEPESERQIVVDDNIPDVTEEPIHANQPKDLSDGKEVPENPVTEALESNELPKDIEGTPADPEPESITDVDIPEPVEGFTHAEAVEESTPEAESTEESPIHEPETVAEEPRTEVGETVSPGDNESASHVPESEETEEHEDELSVPSIEEQSDNDNENSQDKESTESQSEITGDHENTEPETQHPPTAIEPESESPDRDIKDESLETEGPPHADEASQEAEANLPSSSHDEESADSSHVQPETEEHTQPSSEALPHEESDGGTLPIVVDEDKPIDNDPIEEHEPQDGESPHSHAAEKELIIEEEAGESHHIEPEADIDDDVDTPHVPSNEISDQPSSETTGLNEETPREPEPTPAGPVDNETSTHDEQLDELHVPSVSHINLEQPTPDESEGGGAPIEDSHISNGLPSSPFIESPPSHQMDSLLSSSNPHDEDASTHLDFEEPHPSPVSEHHPASLLPEEDSEDEGILLTVHDQEPMESPTQSHSMPDSGLHAEATPLSEEGENPFEDPENMLSPSDVLSPGEEIEEPIYQNFGGIEEPGDEEDEDGKDVDSVPASSGHDGLPHETEAEHEATHDISRDDDDEEEDEEEEDKSSAASEHLPTHGYEEEHHPSHDVLDDDDEPLVYPLTQGHGAVHSSPPHEDTDSHGPEQSPSTPPLSTQHFEEGDDESPASQHSTQPQHIQHSDSEEEPPVPHQPTNPTQPHIDHSEDEDEDHNSSPAFSGGFA